MCSDGSLIFNTTYLPHVLGPQPRSSSPDALSSYKTSPSSSPSSSSRSISPSTGNQNRQPKLSGEDCVFDRLFSTDYSAIPPLSNASVLGMMIDLLSGCVYIAFDGSPFYPIFG